VKSRTGIKQDGTLGEAHRFHQTFSFQRSVPFGCFTPYKCHTKIEGRNISNFTNKGMTLVTIWPSAVGITRNQRGQISLFFSASLIVLITIIAFVINIGLFVKAKINLQNSVDAAAYAGASVQARQLTRIAYLNWEMRNVFKEWMFKYYVLGNVTTEGQL
jgi:hypothetical protein